MLYYYTLLFVQNVFQYKWRAKEDADEDKEQSENEKEIQSDDEERRNDDDQYQ